MSVVKHKADKRFQKMAPLTPEKLKKIVSDIEKGSPAVIACEANGLSEVHFYDIIKQGKLDLFDELDTIEAWVAKSLRENEQKLIHRCSEKIETSEKGHRGAEWTLERRHWRYFSQNVGVLELTKELEELKKQLAEKDKSKGK
jgi:hypothetical protein